MKFGFRSSPDKAGGNNPFGRVARIVTVLVLALFVLLAMVSVTRQHFYFMEQVREDEIGIRIRGNRIVDIVPPGVYTDLGLFVRLDTYSTQEFKFRGEDAEVITSDQQRVGVVVSGSVFRPGLGEAEQVKKLWTQYRLIYTNDQALQTKLNDLGMQAMKVCVGDRSFQDSVIGSDRDALRQCVDLEINKLASPFGLKIMNVVVPNVTLSPEVQAKMDAITQSRLDTEKALQDEKKAVAEGKAQQAAQEAAIRVEQSKQQEQARQQTILAQLDVDRLKAEQNKIAAQKANELLAAQKELEIAQAKAAAAAEQAKADLAKETALAILYADNPEYAALLIAQANASAIKESDKFIFTPSGVFPNLVFGNGVLPTINLPTYGPNPSSPTPTPSAP